MEHLAKKDCNEKRVKCDDFRIQGNKDTEIQETYRKESKNKREKHLTKEDCDEKRGASRIRGRREDE